jgi:hypothetical protein
MRAQLKRLHSPDIHDLESYAPEEPDRFGFLLQLMVGPEGSEGEESYDLVVCTARWLEARHADEDLAPLRHHVLVHRYDYPVLREGLRKLIARCVGETWDDVTRQLGRIGRWEFEDYVP